MTSSVFSFWSWKNLAMSLWDNLDMNCIREPAVGGIVQCELLFDVTLHSGIYVGNGKIVHLEGDGNISCSTGEQFLRRLGGFNSAISIYTDCNDMTPSGHTAARDRALSWVGKPYRYHLLNSNCHRFTARCLTGESCNDVCLASDLDRFRRGTHWRVWRR
ncbi:lecithin retinol acyltransferase family protein [Tatumella sp. JGM130]|uniref:lecithin retinol acyltransferase family protein n=1 Tax=Tatumella sp. JGM130 TaxID=2799797 RepID=UPI002011F31E|nr:lecithin retinol acyltransferase family protein [Tatumella sp. JGM130]